MDEDIEQLNREALLSEVKKRRTGIRAHRDRTRHELWRYHPQLWNLLPEKIKPEILVSGWPQFYGAVCITANH